MSTPSTPVMPPPSPAPTTLAAQPVGTMFTLAAGTGMEAFNVVTSIYGTSNPTPIAGASGQLATTSSGFLLTLPDGSQAIIDTSATSTQRVASNLYQYIMVPGTLPTAVTFFQAGLLTYSAFGTWDEGRGAPNPANVPGGNRYSSSFQSPWAEGVVAYGLKTQQMPISGSATFTGTAAGLWFVGGFGGAFSSTNAKLVADFSAGSLAGAIANLTPVGFTGRLSDVFFTGGTITGAGFAGSVVVGDNASASNVDFAGSTGSFAGQFDGPNAAEVSGTFTLTDGRSANKLVGSFAASGASTPAGQPTPTPLTPPVHPPVTVPTWNDVPSGTQLNVFDESYGSTFDPNPRLLGGTRNVPVERFTKTATGFSFTDEEGNVGTFNTTAGSAQVLGPNHFLGPVTKDPTIQTSFSPPDPTTGYFHVVTESLTYANYGIWARILDSTAAAAPGLDPSTVSYGAFAYGVITPSAQVPTTGSATYTGDFRGVFEVEVGGALLQKSTGAVTGGNVALNVNFGANTMQGGITNVTTLSQSGAAGRLNDIILSPGNIFADVVIGTRFLGRTAAAPSTAATTLDVTNGTGNYNGRFYGPNAAEVGGALELEGGTSTNRVTVFGAFIGKK